MPNTERDTSRQRLILGCNALSTLPTRRAAFRLLEAAVAWGVRHFDTARNYGRGFSERVLGEFLAGWGAELRVTTKSGPPSHSLDFLPTRIALPINALRRRSSRVAGFPIPQHPAPTRIITRQELELSIDASLRCLKRDWIDVFLLHECLPSQLDDQARDFLTKARADGTLRTIGIGTNRSLIENHYTADPICEVLQYDRPLRDPLTLMERFPHAIHIHHSIFRDRTEGTHADVIQRCMAANPRGFIVFGTRRVDHLRTNIAAVD